ncbi:hypothetical protein F5Y15DRAFT_39531 [Xylariaceae sp. FL0016]|nr:hypothetical protein F5Y15DRAFT_39531 [Xylariaceae sp. FL0016]
MYPAKTGREGMMVANRVLLGMAQWSTALVSGMLDRAIGRGFRAVQTMEQGEEKLAEMMKQRPKVEDDAWTSSPDLRKALTAGLTGAFETGGRGAAWEFYLNGKDWGFELEDVQVEPGQLVMWHGGEDINCPVQSAKKTAELIKNADLRISESDAHISIVAKTVDEVVQTLNEMLLRT